MEDEPQLSSAHLGFFHKDNIRYKTLDDITSFISDLYITSSVSDLYLSIRDTRQQFEQRYCLQGLLWDPRQAVGKLIVCNKTEALKAEELIARLHFEMKETYNNIESMAGLEADVVCPSDLWEYMLVYFTKWADALCSIEKIFGILAAKGEQMQMLWERTERLTEELREDEGTELFHQILRERLVKFGIEEVEEILDEFVASKEDEAHEAERKRKESEGLKALDIAREGFKEVFDGLKEELEELKRESWEVREELAALKRGEGY